MKKSNLVALNAAESETYFSSPWYKNQIKAKREKLIELKIIKEKRK